jgi:hypothetical protein
MKGEVMKRNRRVWVLGAGVALAAALMLLTTLASAASSGGAQHVRWDIIHLAGGAPPGPITAGGQASATAANGGDTITLTGSGTFVAPASGGGSGAATGGGTWSASGGGNGTYEVTGLVSWESAGPQVGSPFIDQIDDGTATNGAAVLKIAFSDGSQGVLTVGCHGPGAPAGIFEGIATTKGYKTYYIVSSPAGGVDANRTIFHVR